MTLGGRTRCKGFPFQARRVELVLVDIMLMDNPEWHPSNVERRSKP